MKSRFGQSRTFTFVNWLTIYCSLQLSAVRPNGSANSSQVQHIPGFLAVAAVLQAGLFWSRPDDSFLCIGHFISFGPVSIQWAIYRSADYGDGPDGGLALHGRLPVRDSAYIGPVPGIWPPADISEIRNRPPNFNGIRCA